MKINNYGDDYVFQYHQKVANAKVEQPTKAVENDTDQVRQGGEGNLAVENEETVEQAETPAQTSSKKKEKKDKTASTQKD